MKSQFHIFLRACVSARQRGCHNLHRAEMRSGNEPFEAKSPVQNWGQNRADEKQEEEIFSIGERLPSGGWGESNPTMAPPCETTTWQGYKCARTVPWKSRKSKVAKVHGLPSCFARKQKSWTLLCTSVIHLYSKELVVIDRQCVFGKHFKEEVVMYC